MRHRMPRVLTAGALVAAMAMSAAGPTAAQIPGLPDLPDAPNGALGAILDPLEDLLEDITEPLGDALGGTLPLNNAVRLTGEDAVEAAIALSRITFPDSEIAFIGRDDVFADTLSSVAGQGIAGAPLLLTQTDGLDDRTAEELTRLGSTRIIILGSTSAISERLEAELVDFYGADDVTRIGGPSRVETSALLAEAIAPDATDAILLRAYNDAGSDQSQAYADALSVGPYASTNEWPALLSTSDSLHPAIRDHIESSDIARVTIVGGEAAISPAVADELTAMGITVDRVDGENRWDTAIRIAARMGILDASDANRLIVTEGGALAEPLWAAGFAAAAQGAVFESPIILVDGALLPPETLAFLGDGLLRNALRLNNVPVICNSFVSFLACETVALLLVGQLDAVNELTGGALGELLGPAFDPLAEALAGLIPAPDGTSPGLIGQILALIGVGGSEETPESTPCTDGIDNDEDGDIDNPEECDAAFAAAMAGQPEEVSAAFTRMVGADGDRISTSRQAVLIEALTELNGVLGGPIDTTDPAQAAALVAVLDGITTTVGNRSGEAPVDALTDLLEGLESLVGDLLDAALVGNLVADLGVDVDDVVGGLTDAVGGLLASGTSFAAEADLVRSYGQGARPLADAIERISS